MSLDVYLNIPGHVPTKSSGIFIRDGGQTREISREEWDKLHPDIDPVTVETSNTHVYSANITHNLGKMAKEADLYLPLWRPEEIGIKKAGELIEPLMIGLARLENDPSHFIEFNPSNGWGSYEILVSFVRDYLNACKTFPSADVSVWR